MVAGGCCRDDAVRDTDVSELEAGAPKAPARHSWFSHEQPTWAPHQPPVDEDAPASARRVACPSGDDIYDDLEQPLLGASEGPAPGEDYDLVLVIRTREANGEESAEWEDLRFRLDYAELQFIVRARPEEAAADSRGLVFVALRALDGRLRREAARVGLMSLLDGDRVRDLARRRGLALGDDPDQRWLLHPFVRRAGDGVAATPRIVRGGDDAAAATRIFRGGDDAAAATRIFRGGEDAATRIVRGGDDDADLPWRRR